MSNATAEEMLGKLFLRIERSFGWLEIRIVKDKAYVHCQIQKWGLKEARECKKVWDDVRKALPFNKLFSIIFDNDPLLHHWQVMFGQREVCRKDGYILFEQELHNGRGN